MSEAPKLAGLGHIVLRIKDLESSIRFYESVLGLKLTSRSPRMAFFTAPEVENKSHELALMEMGPQIAPPEQNQVGLYHFAWQLTTLGELERFHDHLLAKGVQIVGYGDHGISMGVYFLDPDGNEIEVFYELPRSEWPLEGNKFTGQFPHKPNFKYVSHLA
jgi:catechol 2,3-dioxygenase